MTNSLAANVQTFQLPDVGEGLTEADIVAWHVAVGDIVTINQLIVDIETAKSVVELPSPHAGEVVELFAAIGETVPVGSPIISIRTNVSDSTSTDLLEPDDDVERVGGAQPKLLVGYGATEPTTSRRRRSKVATGTVPVSIPTHAHRKPTPATINGVVPRKPKAKPPVRKLAKTLGVDLANVRPSGVGGIVIRADVIAAAEFNARAVPPQNAITIGMSDATQASTASEYRIPIKGVRKHTAAAMVASAFTAPHVTEFVTVDITKTLELRDALQRRREFRDLKLSPLAFVARAYLNALAKAPTATARWDEAAQEIVVPTGVNLGIAAATPRGLIVPNIRSAHVMGLQALAAAINELATTARAGKTPPEAMTDGNTTITNVGVFGVDTGTPILNPGETTILAVGVIRRQPWVVEDASGERIEPRSILQLALSFDHRVLDGAEGSQVLSDTANLLAEPGLAIL